MAGKVVHIFREAGSGTSTLGRYICSRIEWFFMDTETGPLSTTRADWISGAEPDTTNG